MSPQVASLSHDIFLHMSSKTMARRQLVQGVRLSAVLQLAICTFRMVCGEIGISPDMVG